MPTKRDIDPVLVIESLLNNAYDRDLLYYDGLHEAIRDRQAVGKAPPTCDCAPAGWSVVPGSRAADGGDAEFGGPLAPGAPPRQVERAARPPDSWSPLPLVGRSAGAVEGHATAWCRGSGVQDRVVDVEADR